MNAFAHLVLNNPARRAVEARWLVPRLVARSPTRPAGRALVVGCGRGVDVELAFSMMGATDVVAIDLDPRQVGRARKRLGRDPRVTLRLDDVTALAEPDASFDTVVDFGAIHLCAEWRSAISEVARVLRPGGTFLWEYFVGPRARRSLRLGMAGFARMDDIGFTEAALTAELAVDFDTPDRQLVRPGRALLATALVGDLAGVSVKRQDSERG